MFTSLGVELGKQDPGEASLAKFETMPAPVRTALMRNGIDTVGKLAQACPRGIQEILRRERIADVTTGKAADWATRAKTVALLKR